MNAKTQEVLQAALSLPESDRAEIAASLIHSLDAEADADADAAWADEIHRRLDAIDKGEVQLIPWDEVMRELDSRRDG